MWTKSYLCTISAVTAWPCRSGAKEKRVRRSPARFSLQTALLRCLAVAADAAWLVVPYDCLGARFSRAINDPDGQHNLASPHSFVELLRFFARNAQAGERTDQPAKRRAAHCT